MAHFLTTPLKKPVLRVFALSLVLAVAMPSPAYGLRAQQSGNSPLLTEELLKAAGLEEPIGRDVPLFSGGHFTAAEWIPLLSDYLRQAVREKGMPLQVRLSGPKGREEILLPLPGGMTDPSEKGARSTDWDPNTLRLAFRRIGVDPGNDQEYWTVTLDEMGGEFHFRFAPHESGGSSSLGLKVSVTDDFEKKPEDTENRAQNEWGLFPWEGREPDWLEEAPWEASENLYQGSLQQVADWLRDQSISDWRENKGISEIRIVFPNDPLKIRQKIHRLDERSDLRWMAERMVEEVIPLAGPDAAYEAVLVQDRVEIRPAASPAAGVEESPPKRSGLSRRAWLASVAAAGLGTWWLTRQPEERFLEPQEVPEPWKQLFKPNEGAKPLPFLGDDYFRFRISSRHLGAAYRAFDRDGKELGSTDATRGDYQRIVDPRTGETLGYYRMPVQWGLNLGVERFVLKDGAGGEMMTVSVYPYVQKGAVITKGIPPTAIEGVPPEWRDPARLKTESTRPIYRVFEDEKHQVSRVEMIGYVETDAEKPGRLLDVDKRPIARLEPVQIIYAGQNPQMLQPLDTALASKPGNNRYFTEAPSEKLAEELSGALERFQPVTPDGKKAKLQLAHRWIQLQVLLGKRTVAVDSKKARATGEALVKRSVSELEDFKNPEVRRLLWAAVADFHPWFAMAREAVRHLGWEEDPEILRYVLSQIQQWWIELENPKRNALRDAGGWMTDLTKDLLEEVLLYNGFQSLEDVTDEFKTFLGGSTRLSREFLYIDQPKGSDPALVPLSLMQARLKGFRDVSDVQILLHQAVALQRLGYQVSFLSYVPVANGLEKEEPVKTLSHEWVIMATHPDHQNEAILFSTHREFLKRFGEEILPGAGVTRVTRERILEVNQTLPPGFYLSMEEYSLFPLDASAYLKARDQALKRREAVSSAELLGPGLGLAVESEGEFYRQFEQDLASAYVRAMAERFDEIVKETGIKVVTSGLTGSEREVRKAGYGAALGLIPRKLIKDLEKIVFLRETKIVPSREARVENGRVIWENVDLEAEGTYSGKTIESVKGVSTPVHEIVHHWDVHVTNQVHDWRGDLSELFHQISWQRNNGQGSWALRKTTDVDMRDFADRGHGLANEREDIAVNGEQYVMNGAAFRSEARIAMSGGNYAPAVKYLFAKYLLFLDTDGTSFEYSVGSGSPALTWDEVAVAIRTDSEGLNPRPEAKRLGALVEQMREVWQKQRESGKIVQRAAEAPLLAAAGVEEGAVEMDASVAAEYVVDALKGRPNSRISFPPNAGQAYIRELHRGGTLVPKFEELLSAAKTSVITVFPEGTRQIEFSSRMFELMNQNSGHTAGLVRFDDVFWATRINNWTPHLWENPPVGRANGVRILPFPAREGVSVAIDLVSADSTQSMVTFLVRPDPGIAAYPADFWKETLARVREGGGFSSLQAEEILRRRFDEFARRLKGDQPLEIQLRWGEKMVLVDQRKPNALDWKILAEVTLVLVPRYENDGIGISVEAFPDVGTKLFYPNKRGPRSNSTAGLEEGRGFVLVEGVGMLAPSDLPENSYYAVAMGMEQAATLIAAGRAPGRIIAVAIGLEEVSGLAALGVPGDQIVRAWEWPTLAAARDYAVRLGREWLAGLGGLQVSVLEVTARSLQGILAQLREMLPSAWQTDRPISAEDAQNVLDNSV